MTSLCAYTGDVRSFRGRIQPMALGVLKDICGTGGDADAAPCYPTGFNIQQNHLKIHPIFLVCAISQKKGCDPSSCAALHLYRGFLQEKEGSLVFAHGRNRWESAQISVLPIKALSLASQLSAPLQAPKFPLPRGVIHTVLPSTLTPHLCLISVFPY